MLITLLEIRGEFLTKPYSPVVCGHDQQISMTGLQSRLSRLVMTVVVTTVMIDATGKTRLGEPDYVQQSKGFKLKIAAYTLVWECLPGTESSHHCGDNQSDDHDDQSPEGY